MVVLISLGAYLELFGTVGVPVWNCVGKFGCLVGTVLGDRLGKFGELFGTDWVSLGINQPTNQSTNPKPSQHHPKTIQNHSETIPLPTPAPQFV